MTDDECIAIAVLHGAYFWPRPNTPEFERATEMSDRGYNHSWFAIDAGFDELNGPNDKRKWYDQGGSIGAVARMYCERHRLLPEVTDD